MWYEITREEAEVAFRAIGADARHVVDEPGRHVIGHIETGDIPLLAEITREEDVQHFVHEAFYRQSFTTGFRPNLPD